MKIVTCHRCWAWVPAQGDECPECHSPLPLDEADPTRAEMQLRFGAVICRLGAIQFDRRHLPTTGGLWGTTEGLLFLPELMTLADGSLADTLDGGAASNWSWWPLRRKSSRRAATIEVTHSPELSDPVGEFLDRPGAAFYAREEIVRLWNRGRNWTLQRSVGRTLRWTMLTPAELWRPAWRQLFHTADEWRCVSTP